MINQLDNGLDMNFETDPEERKRRLAMMASLATGTPIADIAGQQLNQRLAPIKQLVQPIQPTQSVVQPTAPVQPVMPDETAAETQRLQQQNQLAQGVPTVPETVTPVNPDAVQQVNETVLPKAGPPVEVAGTTKTLPQTQPPVNPAYTPTVEREQQQGSWMDQLASAGNDPTRLAKFMGATENPEAKQAAGKMIAQIYNNNQKQQEAEKYATQAVASGDLLPLMKRIQQEKGEGSYLKAYLYSRLGLNELAKDEQQKLGAGTTYQVAYDANGNKALMEVTANGLPVRGYNEKLQELNPEEFGKFAVGAAPKHAFQMPSGHGGPVQKTIGNEVIGGMRMYDPLTRQWYVQTSKGREPDVGWNLPTQTQQYVYGAAQAGAAGKATGEGFTPQPMKPFPGSAGTGPQSAADIATSLGVPIISGTRTPSEGQQLWDQSVANGTPGRLPNGNPVARPGTSLHETGRAVDVSPQATPEQRQILINNGFVNRIKNDPNHYELDMSKASPGTPVYQQKINAELAQKQKEADIEQQKQLNIAEKKPPAEQRGKNEAKDINDQRQADETYKLIRPISDAIKQSTGSTIGTSVDTLAATIGKSTTGAQNIAKLEVLGYKLLQQVPRMEGSQSNIDVEMYKQAAGDLANSKKPIETRLAALQTIVEMLKLADKKGTNDWSYGEGQTQSGNKTSTGVTWKKVP